MKKGQILTNEEITIVNNLIWEKPVREVAAKIGRSLLAIHYYLKHKDDYPPVKDKCKPMAFAVPTAIVKPQVQKKMKPEPLLTHYHLSERLAFANIHATWAEDRWRSIIFHDERKFNLDGPDGFSYYFHDMRNYERTMSQRPRGGSVYIWLAISFMGTIRCEVSTVKIKPESYLEFLQSDRENMKMKLGDSDFILQANTSVYNNSAMVHNWLLGENIKTQKWPEVAHDINIMENIWGWLIREIYGGGKQFSRKDDLIGTIREASTRVPLCLIQNLYSTMPNRMIELFYTKGRYTNC